MGPLRPETFARHELLSALVGGAAAARIFFGSFESLKAAVFATIFWGWGKIYIQNYFGRSVSETLEKTCKATGCIDCRIN